MCITKFLFTAGSVVSFMYASLTCLDKSNVS
jgi:hypothetical protein